MPKLNRKYKKNRLSNIEVSEVSLVDSPANLQPFLLYKRDGGEQMKIEKDKNLELLEKATESINTIVEKFVALEKDKMDIVALAKEVIPTIKPIIDFCAASFVAKSSPQNLAEEKKIGYNSFVKWNMADGVVDPEAILKVWADWQEGKSTIYPVITKVEQPTPVKKREEMTEDEFAVDFGSVVEVAKVGKKLSKKNVELVKNAIATLTVLLGELEQAQKSGDKPVEDPLEKEIAALSLEEKREIEKKLSEIKAKLDSLEKVKV